MSHPKILRLQMDDNEASSIPRTHKSWAPLYKILSPWCPGFSHSCLKRQFLCWMPCFEKQLSKVSRLAVWSWVHKWRRQYVGKFNINLQFRFNLCLRTTDFGRNETVCMYMYVCICMYVYVCIYIYIYKVKVKITLEQATKAQRGSRGIALLFP